jgi:uncharacterized protein (DUF1015 family)
LADIYPFSGVRYDHQKVGDIARVVSPPYDVISEDDQEALKARSPYNAVHIDLPRVETSIGSDRYRHAGQLWRQWLGQGVVCAEKQPAFYAYRQTYTVPVSGETRQLLGFIAAVRLVPWSEGVVLPHEHTFAKPKQDRLQLMRATAAQLSPVYGFYSDPTLSVEEAWRPRLAVEPQIAVRDDHGNLHEMWVIQDVEEIKVAQATLAETRVFIADGHHRYETALTYQKERSSQGTDPHAPWNNVMMMLVNIDAGGLTILPTHRVLFGIPPIDIAGWRRALDRFFAVTERRLTEERAITSMVQELVPGQLVVYLGDGQCWLLQCRDLNILWKNLPSSHSMEWKSLDVSVLHGSILEGMMQLPREALDRQEILRYTRDASEACNAVDSGEGVLAFLLPAPGVEAVGEVALAGDVMPQKSTYFYPKLLTGLVFADLAGSQSG